MRVIGWLTKACEDWLCVEKWTGGGGGTGAGWGQGRAAMECVGVFVLRVGS